VTIFLKARKTQVAYEITVGGSDTQQPETCFMFVISLQGTILLNRIHSEIPERDTTNCPKNNKVAKFFSKTFFICVQFSNFLMSVPLVVSISERGCD
jgi:hypothetical protein